LKAIRFIHVHLELGYHFVAWLLLLDIVDEGTNSMIKPHTHFISILKVNRWIPDKTDAFGSSSQDDAARFESGALGEEGDCLTDAEYLFGGCAILKSVAVQCAFQEKLLWIRDSVVGYKTWAKGIRVVKTLGETPLGDSQLVLAE